MKKTVLAVSLVAIFVSPLFAAPAKKSVESSPSYSSSGRRMEGKKGIGAGVNGIGYRYWSTDESAWDLNFGFSTAKDTKSFDLGGSYLSLLRSTGNLHFMSLVGLQYGNTQNDNAGVTSKQTDFTIGAGLNVEYFFTELPDLGFNATLTGLSIDFRSTDIGGASQSSTNFATVPLVTFGVRYYFK
jgi:hypothetical protein